MFLAVWWGLESLWCEDGKLTSNPDQTDCCPSITRLVLHLTHPGNTTQGQTLWTSPAHTSTEHCGIQIPFTLGKWFQEHDTAPFERELRSNVALQMSHVAWWLCGTRALSSFCWARRQIQTWPRDSWRQEAYTLPSALNTPISTTLSRHTHIHTQTHRCTHFHTDTHVSTHTHTDAHTFIHTHSHSHADARTK